MRLTSFHFECFDIYSIFTWSEGQEVRLSAGLGDGVTPIIDAAGYRDYDTRENGPGLTIDDCHNDGSQFLGLEVALGRGHGLEDVSFLFG
jgi:hypothetical protein